MKKRRVFFLVIIITGLIVLIPWCSYDDQSLGGDYYHLPLYEAIDVGYPGGAIIYKSHRKRVFNKIVVEGDVVAINSNDDFIIAIQDKRNKGDLYTEEAEARRVRTENYFIILKKEDKVFGPYDKTEYLQKRKDLGVPNDLQFK